MGKEKCPVCGASIEWVSAASGKVAINTKKTSLMVRSGEDMRTWEAVAGNTLHLTTCKDAARFKSEARPPKERPLQPHQREARTRKREELLRECKDLRDRLLNNHTLTKEEWTDLLYDDWDAQLPTEMSVLTLSCFTSYLRSLLKAQPTPQRDCDLRSLLKAQPTPPQDYIDPADQI